MSAEVSVVNWGSVGCWHQSQVSESLWESTGPAASLTCLGILVLSPWLIRVFSHGPQKMKSSQDP